MEIIKKIIGFLVIIEAFIIPISIIWNIWDTQSVNLSKILLSDFVAFIFTLLLVMFITNNEYE